MVESKISNSSANKNDSERPDQPRQALLMIPPNKEQVSPPPTPAVNKGEHLLVVPGKERRRLSTDELNRAWPLGARRVIPSEEPDRDT